MIRKVSIVFLLIISTSLSAQKTSSSPYSFFGIGEKFSPRTAEQNSMGGIGVAFSHYKYLNFTNPAAYSDLRFTTYAFGLSNNRLTIKDASSKQKTSLSGLNYVALGVPVGSKAGLFLGIQPISSVGYSISKTILGVDEGPNQIAFFSGKGGINRVHGGFGIKLLKGLSLGLEGDFSFGKIENSIVEQVEDVSLATKYKEESTIRGGSISLGAQYQQKLKNNLFVTVGAVAKLENTLKVDGNSLTYSLSYRGTGEEIPRDTLADANGEKTQKVLGNYKLPLKTIIGAGLGKLDKWYAGVEYESQNRILISDFLSGTNATSTNNGAYKYGKSDRISLGGFYIPKINSISSYWSRVTYRAGLRFEKTGLLIDESGNGTNFTPIDDFGISFGLGLPLGNRYSNVNLGFEYGEKGTTSNNLIQENYFNFRLSLSLTDISWFIKRKID